MSIEAQAREVPQKQSSFLRLLVIYLTFPMILYVQIRCEVNKFSTHEISENQAECLYPLSAVGH